MPKEYFAVLAIGKDDFGLVSRLCGTLVEADACNVENSQMMKLGGHFATVLIASSETGLRAKSLETKLRASGAQEVYVSSVSPDDFSPLGGREPSYQITAEADDRPGVLHEVSSVLADHKVLITGLVSHCPVDGKLLCSIGIEVAPPHDMGEKQLKQLLDSSLDEGISTIVEPLPMPGA